MGNDEKIVYFSDLGEVKDVLEFASYGSFPETGEPGKIYVAKDVNRIYRWSEDSDGYVEIADPPVTSVNGQDGHVVLTAGDIGYDDGGSGEDTVKDVLDDTYRKDEVNALVQSNAAHYRGYYATWSDVPSDASLYPEDNDGNRTPGPNDYMAVGDMSDYPDGGGSSSPSDSSSPDAGEYSGAWRMTYSGAWNVQNKNGWKPAFQYNESPLTEEQLAALDSGITAALVGKLRALPDNGTLTRILSEKRDRDDLSYGGGTSEDWYVTASTIEGSLRLVKVNDYLWTGVYDNVQYALALDPGRTWLFVVGGSDDAYIGGSDDAVNLATTINGVAYALTREVAADSLALVSQIPTPVAPSTAASAQGRPADAKATGDALAGKLSISGGMMRGALRFYDPAVGPEEDMYEDWLSFYSSGDEFRFALGVNDQNAAPLLKWSAMGQGVRRAQFQDKSGTVAFLEDLPYSLVAPEPSGASLPAGVTVWTYANGAKVDNVTETAYFVATDEEPRRWKLCATAHGNDAIAWWSYDGTPELYDESIYFMEICLCDSDGNVIPDDGEFPNLVLTYPLADRAVSKVSVASGVEVAFSFPELNEGRSRNFYIRLNLGGDDTPITLPDDVDIEVLGGRMPDMSDAGTYIIHFRETDEDVFEMSSTGPVMTSPYDRTVDYVRSDGSQYIDTGIIGREGTTVTVDMAGLGNVKNMAMFGVIGDDGATYMAMRYNQNLRVIYGMSGGDGDGTVSPFTFNDATRHVISCAVSANGTLSVDVDGTRKINAQNVGRFSSGSAMFLFAGNRSGVPSYTAIMRLYRCSIRQDGVPVRDYIPCVRNGRAGLYDTISGKVSFSLSGTDFILPESEVDDL